MGFGKMEKWVIDKIHLDKEGKTFTNNGISLKNNIPIFHHSIIPCVRQKHQGAINPYIYSKL